MRICVLHIGTHKTGTTSIQTFLTSNELALGRQGIYVPQAGRPRRLFGSDEIGHHNVAWELNGDPRFEPAAGTLADVVDEVAACRQNAVVVSSEDFEYLHAKPEALERIASAFKAVGFVVLPLVYLRAQTRYAISLYYELLRHGLTVSPENFIADIRQHGEFRFRDRWVFQFRYSVLLDAFAAVFDRSHVIARPYAEGKPKSYLLRDFLSVFKRFDVPLDFGKLRLPSRLNRSLPPRNYKAPDLAEVFQDDNAWIERTYDFGQISMRQPATNHIGAIAHFFRRALP